MLHAEADFAELSALEPPADVPANDKVLKQRHHAYVT